jgi:hypothetical protein
MKTWYRAVCDEHKSMCHVIVIGNWNLCNCYLENDGKQITEWLTNHSGCKLRLVHSDEELESLLGVYQDCLR